MTICLPFSRLRKLFSYAKNALCGVPLQVVKSADCAFNLCF